MNRTLLGYRTMLNLNQKQLGERIGMSKSAYCLRETGQREFRASEMEAIMEILHSQYPSLTVDDIFFNIKVAK